MHKPSDPQLMLALDRAWIYKQAHKTLRDLGYDSIDVMDTLAVAEFMANVPRPSQPLPTEYEADTADDPAEETGETEE